MGARAKIKNRPKGYWDNFYFSLKADDSSLVDVVKRLGSERFMIGSDYPHPDGTSGTVNRVRAIEGLCGKDKENLLGGTAARFFNLKGAR